MSTRYYRKVHRDGDKLKSTYVGTLNDPVVQVLKRRDRLDTAERKAQKVQHQFDRDRLARIDYLLRCERNQLAAALRVWLRTQSLVIGKAGLWQRKKTRQSRRESVPVNLSRDDFEELLALVENGNETALQSLRAIMRADRDTWFPFGDLASHARKLLIDSLTRGETVARESLMINLEEMRADLRGDVENCVRDHAVEHVITCYVDLQRQTIMNAETAPSRSAADFNERRLDQAQKRYHHALKFLNDLDLQLKASLDPRRERSNAESTLGSVTRRQRVVN